ncbi:MAG: hypothetical protein K9M07_03140 [Simkaniaceae bacterium]|nr:hypothetical protein [Simkaniaceae bacterium]MCF7852218.1 hypothetical protein [Simkaniaceae bacterium]
MAAVTTTVPFIEVFREVIINPNEKAERVRENERIFLPLAALINRIISVVIPIWAFQSLISDERLYRSGFFMGVGAIVVTGVACMPGSILGWEIAMVCDRLYQLIQMDPVRTLKDPRGEKLVEEMTPRTLVSHLFRNTIILSRCFSSFATSLLELKIEMPMNFRE